MDLLAFKPRLSRLLKRVRLYGIVTLLYFSRQNLLEAQGVAEMPAPASTNVTIFYLEVSLSGEATKEVVPFLMFPGDILKVTRGTLTSVGVKIPGEGMPDQLLVLNQLPDVTYDYDASKQTINLKVPDSYRTKKRFDASSMIFYDTSPTATGFFLNYGAFTGGTLDWTTLKAAPGGTSLNLDANFFSPLGTFSQGGYILTTDFSGAQVVRLDTTWQYSSPAYAWTWKMGDFTSGALSWTNPIRMAGLQLRRNFATRPNLVTTAMPSLEGTAAVPSTVDILVNDQPRYTQDVGSGPFLISNLPAFTGFGRVKMLVRNATGQVQLTEFNYFATPILLKKGLSDYSLEAGFARRGFGADPFDYDLNPIGSASGRYGFNNYWTGDFHAEGGAGLINVGLGSASNIIPASAINVAVSGSFFENQWGLKLDAGWLFQMGQFSFYASTARSFLNFSTLATATQRSNWVNSPLMNTVNAVNTDQVTLAYGFTGLGLFASIAGIRSQQVTGVENWTVSGSLNKSFGRWVSVSSGVYSNFGASDNLGVYVNLSIPLGQSSAATAGGGVTNGQWSGTAQVSKGNPGDVGDIGWLAGYQETGANRKLNGSGDWLSKIGHLRAQSTFFNSVSDSNSNLYLNWDGSLAIAGGGAMLGNRINDSFAVVKVKGESVGVNVGGRYLGKTGKTRGTSRLLVNQLVAYQRNKIALDLSESPLLAEATETEQYVVPRDKVGVVVDFGEVKQLQGATVILKNEAGQFLPTGTAVILEGNAGVFVVGMDGEAYVTGLTAVNKLKAYIEGGTCGVSFDFVKDPSTIQLIGPLLCKADPANP